MISALLIAALALSAAMAVAWAVQRATGNSGWIDATWSLAVGVTSAALALAPAPADGATARQLLLAGLIGLWALRLGGYIAGRSFRAKEDPRYAWLINEWGPSAPWRLFYFLQVQALAGLILAASVYVAALNGAPGLRLMDYIGLAVFLTSLAGAALADEQLRRFRADPANHGKVCDTGLWAWSRHPNYFFEWLGWTAFPLIALSGGDPWGLIALAAPVLMYVLLAHVSGVPPLEAHMERSRGAAFAAYKARVNAFFPGPPRAPSP